MPLIIYLSRETINVAYKLSQAKSRIQVQKRNFTLYRNVVNTKYMRHQNIL